MSDSTKKKKKTKVRHRLKSGNLNIENSYDKKEYDGYGETDEWE